MLDLDVGVAHMIPHLDCPVFSIKTCSSKRCIPTGIRDVVCCPARRMLEENRPAQMSGY